MTEPIALVSAIPERLTLASASTVAVPKELVADNPVGVALASASAIATAR